ncbi:MFS transporter [Bradyrhizobium sp.]|uniref:MFS transporter n=1 Tax=Bradyrhizobium sp. TaxID=376 RepID=UPI0025BBFC6C|nr:MFS transporter [Bradyrhizobium sp.]MBV8918294.1 MFS transporter [Bradyrhizobium sp.]
MSITAETIESVPASVDSSARKALLGSAVGYAMDGFDLLILGFMLRTIAGDLKLSPAQSASLVTATLIGAVLGGIGFGMLSDRLGRVRVLTWSIVLFAVFTGLCAFAQGYLDLLIFRGIAGIGLGGEFGIGMALVAEAWPASKRARASSYVGLGWQAGVLAAALVTPLLLPLIGWRGMFALGVFPAIAAYVIRASLHEPDVFVARSKDHPRESALHLLVKDGETAKLSLGMVILCSVQNFGYYGVMIWLPNYLSARFGFALTQSSLWTCVTIAGMALGIVLFGHIADRVGRRPAFLGYMSGAAIMVLVYSRLTDPIELLVAGAVMGFFVNGMLGGYGALISELFPTAARATAQNVLFNIGRGVGGFGPVVIGAIASAASFETAIALLAVLYGLDIVAMWFLIPERRGAELA